MHLYHTYVRTEGLRGNTLYTLNELKTKHPDLYSLHIAKYDSREHVLGQRFSCIDCAWPDVVFLCPVHPEKVCSALLQYRRRPVPSFAYHAIPIADLDPLRLAIWPFKKRDFDPNEVTPLDHNLLQGMQEIPEATLRYFTEQWEKKEPALFFVHIPHVVYKGSIDMEAYPIQHTSVYKLPK